MCRFESGHATKLFKELQMFKNMIVACLLFGLAGCGYQIDVDKVMGRSPSTTQEPAPPAKKLDCNLIFP